MMAGSDNDPISCRCDECCEAVFCLLRFFISAFWCLRGSRGMCVSFSFIFLKVLAQCLQKASLGGAFGKFVDEKQADKSALCTINRHLRFPQEVANAPVSY